MTQGSCPGDAGEAGSLEERRWPGGEGQQYGGRVSKWQEGKANKQHRKAQSRASERGVLHQLVSMGASESLPDQMFL